MHKERNKDRKSIHIASSKNFSTHMKLVLCLFSYSVCLWIEHFGRLGSPYFSTPDFRQDNGLISQHCFSAYTQCRHAVLPAEEDFEKTIQESRQPNPLQGL